VFFSFQFGTVTSEMKAGSLYFSCTATIFTGVLHEHLNMFLLEHFDISVYWHGFENSCQVTEACCVAIVGEQFAVIILKRSSDVFSVVLDTLPVFSVVLDTLP